MRKRFTKPSLSVFVLIILLTISLWGAARPSQSYITKSVGDFRIRPYKYGIFISDKSYKDFYNISPYDAYFINKENKGINLLKWGPYETHSKESQKLNAIKSLINSVITYFNAGEPKATFYTDTGVITYRTRTEQNKVEISAELSSKYKVSGYKETVMTISFHEDNYIFDDNRILYTDNSAEDIEKFNLLYRRALKPFNPEGRRFEIENFQNLYIVSPKYPGVLKINKSQNYPSKVLINKNSGRIEFLRDSGEKIKITIKLYDSLKDAQSI